MKRALVTGIAGQDGPYLARHLLKAGYEVIGTYRSEATGFFHGLDFLGIRNDVKVCPMDLTEYESVFGVVNKYAPSHVFNLAAQSHVGYSFKTPVSTLLSTGLGVVHLLEAIRAVRPSTVFYQASTSELYGGMTGPDGIFNEETKFHPRSPYACAKLYAFAMVQNYREAYGMHASNGILFNHESPLRGPNFVTRKVTMKAAEILRAIGLDRSWTPLEVGNIDATRDWGHAEDYTRAMMLMTQASTPGDYVVATGVSHSIRELIQIAFSEVYIRGVWVGDGLDAKFCDESGIVYAQVNPEFFRPSDCVDLNGDASKISRELGWAPEHSFHDLIAEMVEADLERLDARSFDN